MSPSECLCGSDIIIDLAPPRSPRRLWHCCACGRNWSEGYAERITPWQPALAPAREAWRRMQFSSAGPAMER